MFNYEHGKAYFPWSFQAVIEYLTYSSVYISLAAGVMAFISSVFHHVPFNPAVFLIGFLITYAVYNLNRKTDEKEDAINHKERYGFTKKYERWLYYSAIFAYVFGLILAGYYGVAAFLAALFPLVSGIAYSLPLLPARTGFRRMKEIPLMKSLLVASAWAIPPSLLPVFIGGGTICQTTLVMILFFFSLVFINTVLFDMRDVEGDRQSGVRTIPVILGIEHTRALLTAINMILGLGILFLAWSIAPVAAIAILIVGILYAQIYIFSYKVMDLGHILCDLVADGQFIGLGILVYIANSAGLIHWM
ncbi:MAG TPA: UbiA family prenyltransferase [Methanoregulaceae archaeon]|nr:UbiA family prenyltransferase [Methanoregulaceae archaeon]